MVKTGIRYRSLIFLAGMSGLMALLLTGGCTRTEPPTPSGQASGWSHVDFLESYTFVGNVFEDKDLSGIAFLSATRGLIGADESGLVQAVELSRSDRTWKILEAVSLLGSGDEIDIEAMAAEGDSYYVVGSHGVAKKSGEYQAKRYTICRVPADRATGLPAGEQGVSVSSLAALLKADPVLGPYFAKPLQEKGVNIEGLAIRGGRLFVGLRNPNIEGNAFVVEVGADGVFARVERPAYTRHKLKLGAGLGIRDMAAARKGFLLIAGNAGSEPSEANPKTQDYEKGRGYVLFHWDDGSGTVQRIGEIPNPPGKAEAIMILDETADQATVLILFDGPRQGRPSAYRLH